MEKQQLLVYAPVHQSKKKKNLTPKNFHAFAFKDYATFAIIPNYLNMKPFDLACSK